jgi:serine/threonine protein kinase
MAVSEARGTDPRRVADALLAAAVRASADAVYIEPRADNEDAYGVIVERDNAVIAQCSLDAMVGAAAIARLAFIASLDLTSPTATSAITRVRSGDRDADVVITIRPGNGLRAELVVLKRARPKRAPTHPGATNAGEVIGNYRIVERLGEGGMGTVFSVEHVVLGRPYALKVLRSPVFARDPTASARFLREARAASRVRHPNIGDVFDFGHLADGRPYFVMELLEGESLADRVSREPLEPPDAISIGRQLAGALAAVHDHGVVHADVTPSNALIVGHDPLHVKLIDFGLAAIAGEVAFDDQSDFVLGTPAYISPEQLRGLPATDRSDQYGLGCVLFELITGHPPYMHRDLRELCMMHIEAPIPVATSMFGPLPPKLGEVVTTCLQKSPQQRFTNMRAMLAALDEIEKVTERRGWRRWLSS